MAQTPIITWGSSYEHTIALPYEVDKPTAWSTPKAGHVETRADGSPDEDSMLMGHDYFFQCELLVPTELWDGAGNVKAWISRAIMGEDFKWQPYAGAVVYTCYLDDPTKPNPTLDPTMEKRIQIKIRTANNVPFAEY